MGDLNRRVVGTVTMTRVDEHGNHIATVAIDPGQHDIRTNHVSIDSHGISMGYDVE